MHGRNASTECPVSAQKEMTTIEHLGISLKLLISLVPAKGFEPLTP